MFFVSFYSNSLRTLPPVVQACTRCSWCQENGGGIFLFHHPCETHWVWMVLTATHNGITRVSTPSRSDLPKKAFRAAAAKCLQRKSRGGRFPVRHDEARPQNLPHCACLQSCLAPVYQGMDAQKPPLIITSISHAGFCGVIKN